MTDADLIRVIADVGYSPEHDTLNHDSTRNWLYRIAKRLERIDCCDTPKRCPCK